MKERKTKIFRDNVHGYIEIPVEYVNLFIDTELFQRLRGIEQTGMRILYPSARHDRFVHSLGTYFLGHKAFCNFRKNVKSTYYSESGKSYYNVLNDIEKSEKFWDKYGILFEIACLMHDCGHSPFSHALEFHYDQESLNGRISLKEKLGQENGSREFRNDYVNQGSPGTPHERMSALLVCSEYKSVIDQLIIDYELNNIEENCSNVEFIARAIIGCKYCNTDIAENQIKNCLIELLNSKSIDVDSLDYIVRDSKLSGIDNMNIDLERLLGSLTLVEITNCINSQFNDLEISTNIIEGELVKGKSNVATFSGKIIGEFFPEKSIEGTMQGKVDLDGNFKAKHDIEIYPDDDKAVINVNGAKSERLLAANTSTNNIVLKGIIKSELKVTGNEIKFAMPTNGKFNFSCENIKFHSSYVSGKLNGTFTGKLLGNHADLPNSIVECRLGFHKSSLSVIQNVVIARNYEYQWIYSHHKVAYYSNYLVVDLLKKCLEYLLQYKCGVIDEKEINVDKELSNIFSWERMLSDNKDNIYSIGNIDIYRPNDSDITSIFKQCYLDCKKTNKTEIPLYGLLDEYYSRAYKKSLWKSFAEFNSFFSDFTQNERNNIFEIILTNSSYNLLDRFGYLSKEWSDEFFKFGLNNVVWVNGDSILKNLDPDNTFVLFKDGPLTYRSISTTNEIKPVTSLKHLFYIYYFPTGKAINKTALIKFLKDKLNEK